MYYEVFWQNVYNYIFDVRNLKYWASHEIMIEDRLV